MFLSTAAVAQQKVPNSFTVVAGRALSSADSAMVKEWFFEGLKAKSIQNQELATEYFKRVLTIDPANDASLYELANLSHAQNKENEAEHYSREAVTVNPNNEWYWLLLSDIYKKNNDLTQLAIVFDELIKLKPEEEDYYYDKANTLLLLDRVAEAEGVYNDIEKKFGLSEDLAADRQRLYLKQGKSDKVIAEIEKQIKSHPDKVRNYLLLAELYSNDKNKEKALELLLKAKSLDPENAFIRLTLADLYQSTGKSKDAFIELKIAFASPSLEIDSKVRIILSYFPRFTSADARAEAEELSSIITRIHSTDAKAFSVYGDVLYQQRKLAEARTSYQQALKLNNQVYLIWEQLVRIEIGLSDFNSAVKDGEEALTIFPNQAPLYFYTAIAYNQQKKYDKAISYLKNASSLETENKELLGQIYSSLGDAYNALNKFKESDQSYDKALEYNENNTYTLNNYAYYLSLRGEKLERAAEMSRRSNELEADNPSFQDTYAWVLFKQKKYKDARIWMEKAMNNNQGKSGVQSEHYGDILFFLGEKNLALEQWKKARQYGVKSEILERKINEKKYFE